MSPEDSDRLWDEYKYRHQHCWNTIFKLTLAVVAISVLPFTQETVVCVLGKWILLLPAVALALSIFGTIVVYRELRILGVIRARHRSIQGTSTELGRDWFLGLVMFYLVILSFAAGLNLYVIKDWQAAVDAHSGSQCFRSTASK